MKRIVYFLFTFILVFSLMGNIVSFADEGVVEQPEVSEPQVEAETSTDVASPETPPVEATDEAEEPAVKPTVFTRLYEAFVDNKTNVFTLGGSTVLFALGLIFRKEFGSSSKRVVEGIAKVISKADVSDEKQTAIVNGLNEMVDGYNDIKTQSNVVKETVTELGSQIKEIIQSNTDLEKKIDSVFGVLLSLMDKEITQNAEVMEVLSTVYVNNGALPKGVKDFVALKRAENAKIVQEATKLTHPTEGGAGNE